MAGLVSLFSKPKAAGPDKATLAAQRRQEQLTQQRQAEEQREKGGRDRLIRATQLRGGPVTLFAGTGEQGVKSTLGG